MKWLRNIRNGISNYLENCTLSEVLCRVRVVAIAALTLAFAQSCLAAVSKDRIIVGLRRNVPGEFIERIVRREGIAFTMDAQIAAELRTRGAPESLIQTLFEISEKATATTKPNQPPSNKANQGENELPRSKDISKLKEADREDEENSSRKVPTISAVPPIQVEYIDWWSKLQPHLSWKPLNEKTPDTYDYGSVSLFAAKFWLSGPRDVLSKIQRVEYYFDHPSFHPPTKIGKNAGDGFSISYRGFGCIDTVRITIVPRDPNIRPRYGNSINFLFCEEVFKLPE